MTTNVLLKKNAEIFCIENKQKSTKMPRTSQPKMHQTISLKMTFTVNLESETLHFIYNFIVTIF